MNIINLGILCIAFSSTHWWCFCVLVHIFSDSLNTWQGCWSMPSNETKWKKRPHMALASLENKERTWHIFGSLQFIKDKISVHKLLHHGPFSRINIWTCTRVSIGSLFSFWVSILAEPWSHRHVESSSWSALLTSLCLPELYFLSLISSSLERLPWWHSLQNSESLQQFLYVPLEWYLSCAGAKPSILWWTQDLMQGLTHKKYIACLCCSTEPITVPEWRTPFIGWIKELGGGIS